MKTISIKLIGLILIALTVLHPLKSQDSGVKLSTTYVTLTSVRYELIGLSENVESQYCTITSGSTELSCQEGQCSCGKGEIIGLDSGTSYDIVFSNESGQLLKTNIKTASGCTINISKNVIGQLEYTCDFSGRSKPTECFACIMESGNPVPICQIPKEGEKLDSLCESGLIENLNLENIYVLGIFDRLQNEVAAEHTHKLNTVFTQNVYSEGENICTITFQAFLNAISYQCTYPDEIAQPESCTACLTTADGDQICLLNGALNPQFCSEGTFLGLMEEMQYNLRIANGAEELVSQAEVSTLQRTLTATGISLTSITYSITPEVNYPPENRCLFRDNNRGIELVCEEEFCSCNSGKLFQLLENTTYEITVTFNNIPTAMNTMATATRGIIFGFPGPYQVRYSILEVGMRPTTCAFCSNIGTNLELTNQNCLEQVLEFNQSNCESGRITDLDQSESYTVIVYDSERNIYASLFNRTSLVELQQSSQSLTTASYTSNIGDNDEFCTISQGENQFSCINENCLCRGDTIVGLSNNTIYITTFSYNSINNNLRLRTAATCELSVIEQLNSISYTCNYPIGGNIPGRCRSCATSQSSSSETCISEGSYEPQNCINGTINGLDIDSSYQIDIYDNFDDTVSSAVASTFSRNIQSVSTSLTSIEYSVMPLLDISFELVCEIVEVSTGTTLSCSGAYCPCNNGILVGLMSNTEYVINSLFNGEILAAGSLQTANTCTLSLNASLFDVSYSCDYATNSVRPSLCKVCMTDATTEELGLFLCSLRLEDFPLSEDSCEMGKQTDLLTNTLYQVFIYDRDNQIISKGSVSTEEFNFNEVSIGINTIGYTTNIPSDTQFRCNFINSLTQGPILCNGFCECNEGVFVGLRENSQTSLFITYSDRSFSTTIRTASSCTLSVDLSDTTIRYNCDYPENTLSPTECAYCIAEGQDSQANRQNCISELSSYSTEFCSNAQSIPYTLNQVYTLRIFDENVDEIARNTFDRAVSSITVQMVYVNSLIYSVDPSIPDLAESICQVRISESQTPLLCESGLCSCAQGRLVNLTADTLYDLEIYFQNFLIARGPVKTASTGSLESLVNGIHTIQYKLSYNEKISPSNCFICLDGDSDNRRKCITNDIPYTGDPTAEWILDEHFYLSMACNQAVLRNLTPATNYAAVVYDYYGGFVSDFNFSTVELNPSFSSVYSEELFNYTVNYLSESFIPDPCYIRINVSNTLTIPTCINGDCNCYNDSMINFPINQTRPLVQIYDNFAEIVVSINREIDTSLSAGAIAGIVVSVVIIAVMMIGVTVHCIRNQ